MESLVLLELHERITLPALLNNAESWTLNKGEMDEIERIEIQALKNLFKLPIQIPNVAVLFTFGTLHTRQRIDQIQLSYLHKILSRHQTHWTLKTLITLEELNMTDFHCSIYLPATSFRAYDLTHSVVGA